jgi:hypothetical protein
MQDMGGCRAPIVLSGAPRGPMSVALALSAAAGSPPAGDTDAHRGQFP